MSRSCHSGWFSNAVWAYPRSSRASPAIRSDRIGLRLWGIAELPFWPGLERLHDLGDLGVLQVADLGREPLERAAEDRDRREERGVPVALDDLGADRVDVEPEVGEDLGLDVRRRGGCTSRPGR